MPRSTPTAIAALLGALGVALGAFGSHGLRSYLEAHQSVQTWQTASQYHLLHAIALLWISSQNPFPRRAYLFQLSGVLLFSGSLYTLALTQIRWLGAITPFGGVAILLGWVALAFAPRPPKA
ncbi:MAG: hypothetical protein RLZZ399_92 [Verrucomicrobiota bacterium]|jgi:uncharacterized membrane protein YgdD (TMEM256/DUF423 family)